ncbi:MAG: hemerythrin domain-containing protein [Burkholderiales bacterium]|nr:hemerythrin domain-containing protein [Burkholderiales bacterium]
MKITSQELQNVAAAEARRFDLYSGIHKAVRAFMADTLLAVGRMDALDEADLAQATARVQQLLEFCGAHLTHENEHVHAAIEARSPGASDRVGQEHEEHVRDIAQLADLVAALRLAAPAQRPVAAQALYRALALFVAGNFQHMHVEETAHNAVLWARYTDAELVALHDELVGSIPPAEMMGVMRWMIPFLSPAERAAVLADLRAKAPPPAFAAVLQVVRPHLSAGEWGKLAQALGMEAVPGLVAI